MNNGKHAYLIMAHNNFVILERLIKMLDDPRNDLYIHINKKAGQVDYEKYHLLAQNCKVHFIKRTNTKWGGYSQIKCVLTLLKAAASTGYAYYHYMSGVDLPLKTQDYIHDFFDRNFGKEFVHFDSRVCGPEYKNRIRYFYLLQDRPKARLGRLLLKFTHITMLIVQKAAGVNRLKNNTFKIQKGADWFSITDSLAKYIISKQALIEKMFKYTSIGDEMFVQTLVWNSEFKARLYNNSYDNDYKACMRYVDWNRGKPYVWKSQDYRSLMDSDYLFARKFDYKTDPNIVEMIYSAVMHPEIT